MSESEAQNERNIFAKNLRHYLILRGKTQSDLVTDLGFTSASMSEWANAKKLPRIDKMQMIASYLNVTLSDLRNDKASMTDEERELNEYLEVLKNRKDMRMLFKLAKGATKEDVEKTVRILEALKNN